MRWCSSRGNAASEWSEDQLDDSFNQTTKHPYCLVFVLYQEGGQETFGDKVPWWSRAAIYPGGPGRYLDNSPFESYFKMENHRSNACTGDPVGAKADMLLS